jgi:hypothetical protein
MRRLNAENMPGKNNGWNDELRRAGSKMAELVGNLLKFSRRPEILTLGN